MNTSAGAARPNPQGSFHYGSINITQTFVLKNEQPLSINGKRRRTINRVSYSPPETPLRLADLHNLTGVYATNFPAMPSNAPARIASSALNASYKGFLEIVFQNNDTDVQTYHLDGYSFFVVGYMLVCYTITIFSFNQCFMSACEHLKRTPPCCEFQDELWRVDTRQEE